jgi:hypothetical protein
MSNLSEGLRHLKNDVQYPASRGQVLAACNNMMDVQPADREWITTALPEGTYGNPGEVVSALLNKV